MIAPWGWLGFVLASHPALSLPNIQDPELNPGDYQANQAEIDRPEPPQATEIIADVEGTLRALGYKPSITNTKLAPQTYAVGIKVKAQQFPLLVFRKPSSRFIWLVMRLKPIKDPNKLTRDNLLRAFIESEKWAPAYLAYNLDLKRFQVSASLDARGCNSEEMKWMIERLTSLASTTQPIWDADQWGRIRQ